MRKIKIILFSLLGIITVVTSLLAYIFGTYNQLDYQRLFIHSVDRFSEYHLSISGSFHFTPSLEPSLSASGIALHSKKNDDRILIDEFKIQIGLRPLFSGTLLIKDLRVANMDVHVTAKKEEEKEDWLSDSFPFPLVEHALFNNVRVFTKDNRVHALSSFMIEAADRNQPIKIQGTGEYLDRSFTIRGQLGLLSDIFKKESPFPVDLNLEWAHATLSVHGIIKNPSHGKGLDLDINFNIPEISKLIDSDIPIEGRLFARGRITGEYDEPELTEVRAEWKHDDDLNIQVAGAVGNLLNYENTDLHFSGHVSERKFLKWLLPEYTPPFNRLVIKFDLREKDDFFNLENVALHLSTPDGLDMQLKGQTHVVADEQPFRSMHMQAAFSSQRTETVKKYLGNFLPEMGPVKGTANIKTLDRDFILSNIDLLAGHGKMTQLAAKGHIGPLSVEPDSYIKKISLNLTLNAKKSSQLAELLNLEHPEIGPVKGNAHLTGSDREIRLEFIDLQAGFPKLLSIQAEGEISWNQIDTGKPVQHSDFTLHGRTSSFQDAFRLYGKNMPNLGQAEASMLLYGKGMVLTGTGLKIRVGSADSLLVLAQGKVDQIFLDNLSNKGIELSASIEGKKTSSLSSLLENSKIPDIGPFSGHLNIQGDSDVLSASKATLKAGRSSGLVFNASGRIDQVFLKERALPRGVRIHFEATAPSTADLSELAGRKIPGLEPFKAEGLLKDQNGFFAVDDLSIMAGNPEQPAFSATGTIGDLFSQQGIKINISFDEKSIIELFELKAVPELGRLEGSILLSDADGSLGIEAIKIETEKSPLIDLKIYGAIDDLLEANEINLNTEFSIPNLPLFGKLFNIELPKLEAIAGSGQLSGADEGAAFKGNLLVGNTSLKSNLVVSFAESPPRISGSINSPNIFLRDFEISPIDPSSKKTGKPKEGPIFGSEPLSLDVLKKINLNLEAQIDKVSGIKNYLNKVHVHVSLQNGLFIVAPAKFDFSEGRFFMNAKVDTRQTPEFTLNLQGSNVQMGNLLAEIQQTPAIEGNLDLVVDLKSQGNTAHQVASSLNGELGLMLEKGRLRRRELELLFLNPLGWLFSYGINGNEIKIGCGLARYKIKQGIAKSEILYLDGPKLTVRGKGEINLGNETIETLVNLEKKKLLFNTSVPIQIRGSLANPVITQAPINSPLLKADRYLFAPATAIPQELLGTLWDLVDITGDKDNSCQGVLAK